MVHIFTSAKVSIMADQGARQKIRHQGNDQLSEENDDVGNHSNLEKENESLRKQVEALQLALRQQQESTGKGNSEHRSEPTKQRGEYEDVQQDYGASSTVTVPLPGILFILFIIHM